MNKYDISILVLVYGKEIEESKTFLSLNKYAEEFKLYNINLVLWNNGPISIDNDFNSKLDCKLIQTLDNMSLSYIYNKFINSAESKVYVILDDDTELNLNYINNIKKSISYNIYFPEINVNGEKIYPKKEKRNVVFSRKKDVLFTISSGMIIGFEIINKIRNNYGNVFDEDFYLYGVDTSFCLRLSDLNLNQSIHIIDGLEHDLSRLTDNNMSEFKRIERGNDLGVRIRKYYNTIDKLYFLLYFTYVFIRREKKEFDLFSLYKSLLSGKHYR
ncbi:glycosyltransferase family protein [Vibrio hibernica]|uniref:hypothetical protein n=1 Tax=Vibrio hibernica TaxID=2587465 RepID=UPI001881A8AF|nr:hypothetical protein [Vibrio hibernica]